MRLLNTKTLELSSFVGEVPEYAILSHRWEDEEIIFEDISTISLSNPNNAARGKIGFAKVMGTCALAADDGYEWVWIDSCCIDKSSSSELQESINSMFRWYQEAQVCYAYLSDVADEPSGWNKAFEYSRWFTRGWTLQELLAPCNMEFYSADWSPIGTKLSRTELVASITGIDVKALGCDWNNMKDHFSAAQKFSWAAHRQVSKAEDCAYCLFGLFNVNMPLLYGEGKEKAFHRLQRAIYEERADHTLFLFTWSGSMLGATPAMARSADQFCKSLHCSSCPKFARGFPSHLPYSDVITRRSLWPASIQDAYSIQLVRLGIMVKIPLAEVRPTSSNPGSYNEFIALLPLSCRGQSTLLFGIRLRQLSYNFYARLACEPILMEPHKFKSSREGLGGYIIYNELSTERLAGNNLLVGLEVDYNSEIAHFEFRSRCFEPLLWRCQTQQKTWSMVSNRINFPLPREQENIFVLKLSFRSTLYHGLDGAIILWYSTNKIDLREISLSQNGRNLCRWSKASDHPFQYDMKAFVRIGETDDSLKVVIRRFSVFSYAKGCHRIGYRLEVIHACKAPPDIPESERFARITLGDEIFK